MNKIRLVKIDELQFLTCLYKGLWGSKSARFREWSKGDGLVIMVGKTLASLAEVSGEPYSSKEIIWNNGLFPYRIPIKFIHVLDKDQRIPILGDIRQILTDAWGPRYGWGILNQQTLLDESAKVIIHEIKSKPNSLIKFQKELKERIQEAKLERQASTNLPKPKKRTAKRHTLYEPTQSPEDVSLHTRQQSMLIRLGKATGCLIWVAASDRARASNRRHGNEDCLEILPKMGFSDEAARRISYIDVIWIRQSAPICAFEVETTTSIYSGLLRMADLLAVVPALKLDLFVIAPRERQDKVMSELARPTFAKLGLSDYCRFIAAEDLESLTERVSGLSGHIQPTILDTVAIALEE